MKSIHQIDTPEHCEKCGAEMQRQVALSSFQLKGSGWERDGYK